ncbi:hypothetical protein [Pseudomonas sp. B21-035]|uniref:hypothetical protein n=1 Tax=Pseudomonas sp. B21-035 TaxID=2895484 RepID=UPI00215F681B|nr:hypothetical protein [Pseudomonas sp. B21-035]UVL55008.1 hypothetical protein LOY22_19460 [Pseudomonas sp. B21-035]
MRNEVVSIDCKRKRPAGYSAMKHAGSDRIAIIGKVADAQAIQAKGSVVQGAVQPIELKEQRSQCPQGNDDDRSVERLAKDLGRPIDEDVNRSHEQGYEHTALGQRQNITLTTGCPQTG